MPFTSTTIKTEIRGHIPNITTTEISDANLDRYILDALRQMEREFPFIQRKKFTGTGAKFYKLSTIFTDWINDRSSVKRVASPAPTIADDDEIHWLGYSEWEMWDDGTDEYIRLSDALSSPDQALVVYAIPWTINGVESATATNLTRRAEEAIIYLATAITCYALASKAAGTVDSQIPGDILNYRSKEAEYRRMGDAWMKLYNDVIGAGKVEVSAAMVRSDYNYAGQGGTLRMTHPDRTYRGKE